jgi:tetratricopeptide (TPR) repeat protein
LLFKGREAELRSLEEKLGARGADSIIQRCAITGMGGIGKTRLAVEYGWRHQSEFSALLFVPARSAQELDSNLAELSAPEILDLPEYRLFNLREQFAAVEHWLHTHRNWLLILDDVDAPDALRAVSSLLPRLGPGQVIVTSRLRDWGEFAQVLELGSLTQLESASYLLARTEGGRKTTSGESADAQAIAADLGGLALAIELAAAYINTRGIGLADYRRRWQEESGRLIAFTDETSTRSSTSIAATFEASRAQLSPASRLLLNILAWLAPDPIPYSLLKWNGGPFAAEDGEANSEEEWPRSVEAAERSLEELICCSLVILADDSATFSVHSLVQASTRRSLEAAEQVRYAGAALRWVSSAYPASPDDVRFLPLSEILGPHALVLTAEAVRLGIPDPTASLMNRMGLYYVARAEWSKAETLFRRALATSEVALGGDRPEVALGLNNLAQLLQTTNRLQDAEPLMRRALEIDEKNYGGEHPRVARDLNNLASLLQATNRLAEAEPLMRRALEIDEKSYGPEHPDVAIRLNNLSQLLKATNRLAEAEPLMRRALEIDEKSYGSDHPKVAIRLNNLASLLQDTNRLAEAEPLIRRALEIDEKSYGPDHPNVAIDLNNLAGLLQATNRLAEAEPLMRRALGIDEKSYGSEHPNVAIDLNNLAQLLQATNRLAEAEPLMRRALGIDEKSYGSEHPNVAIRLNNLASLLQATNRLAEAEPLMRRALEIFLKFTRSTGHPHPHLQVAINNYGSLLEELGVARDQVLDRLREMAPELFG